MRRPVNAPYQIIKTKNGDVLIDTEDFELVSSYNTWNISRRGDVVCYKESGSRTNRKRQVFKMHRVIMNAPAGMVVDHINGNQLDNRRTNLRLCTQAENGRNLKLKKNNTTGVAGVSWDKSRNKWSARIKFMYKEIYLGRFKEFKDAAKARKEAEIKYFGEFAPKGR